MVTRTKDDRVVDVNLDVVQARINLERDKFLRRRASRRVAAKRLYHRDPAVTVCALQQWVGVTLLLVLWLLRVRSKHSKMTRMKVCVAVEMCAPLQSTCGGEAGVVEPHGEGSGPPSLREKMVRFVSHLSEVIRQRLIMSGDVELNPGPLDEVEQILSNVDNTTFVEDDWNTVVRECSSLAADWEHLSGFLGLSVSRIAVIKGTPPFTPVRCWNEALKEWIQQNYNTGRYGLPSWRTLLEGVARVNMLLFKKLAAEHPVRSASASSETNRGVDSNELRVASEMGELGEVKQLIEEKKLCPLQKDENGNNALHRAAIGGHLPVVQYFIEDQALVPACPGWMGQTALHYAARYNHLNVVKYLIEGQQVDPLCRDEAGYTPLHTACQGGVVSIVSYLVNEMTKHLPLKDVIYGRAEDGNTPAHMATLCGHLQVVKLFISEFNFDPNTPGFKGRPLLHHAAECGHVDVVKYLIEELKCDPSCCPGEDKATSVNMASQNGHVAVVKYLTQDRQCNPLPRNSRGSTPLHTAALHGQFEVVDFFLSQLNCDPNTLGRQGTTPLHFATQGGHLKIVKYLIEEHKCNPLSLDDRKTTPLHLAAMDGHLEVIKYLTKERHCNSLCYDKVLGVPLHYAAYYGQLEAVKYFIEELKCPQNIRGPRNTTPLEEARNRGHTSVVEYLMSR